MQTAIMFNGKRFAPSGGIKGDLVYLGSEFCPNLLPTPAAFGRARRLFKRRVVLVTPFLTDKHLPAVEAVMKEYGSAGEKLEVAANDLGLVELAARRYAGKVSVTAGRVLTRELSWSSDDFLRRFLPANGIGRVEADSREMLDRYLRVGGLSITCHVPYAFAAVTRFCPWEKRWVDEKCGFSCLGRCREISGRTMPRPLRLMDCGYFTRGAVTLKDCRTDRVVYRPSGY